MSSGTHVSSWTPCCGRKAWADDSTDIKHAFHALALDDRRQPFLPTLYYIPNDKVIEEEKAVMKKDEVDWPELTTHRAVIDQELEELRKTRKPDLVQVWFTGKW